MQRIAHALFAKVRHVDDRLAAVDTRLQTVGVLLTAVTVEVRAVDYKLERVLMLLEEQKMREKAWFKLIFGVMMGMLSIIMYMWMYGLYVAYVYIERPTVRIVAVN